jgi:hypothetical protein
LAGLIGAYHIARSPDARTGGHAHNENQLSNAKKSAQAAGYSLEPAIKNSGEENQ